MKLLLALLSLALAGAPLVATAQQFPDTIVKGPPISLPGIGEAYFKITQGQGLMTHRQMLGAYVGKDEQLASAIVKMWAARPSSAASTLAGFQQLAAAAAKAGDSKAAIYRRALDKLTQQMKETAVRQDAQAAVADALKALEVKP